MFIDCLSMSLFLELLLVVTQAIKRNHLSMFLYFFPFLPYFSSAVLSSEPAEDKWMKIKDLQYLITGPRFFSKKNH